MDIVKINFKKPGKIFVFSARLRTWLSGDRIIGKYVFPVKNLLLAALAILFAAILFSYFIFSYYRGQTDPNAAIEKETRALTDQIGKFMEIPEGEVPSLATVTDRGKLKGQDFFVHAQNGDKVLIYAREKKAILFRPSSGKIIEVTNLVSGNRIDPAKDQQSNNPERKQSADL